ncbi:MAG: hypothetical protein SCK28_12470 [Bacillota bacterium]|nr:hypothetical protein [Bacillota bacterium]
MAVSEPAEFWFIEREMRKYILHRFEEEGIGIAYPRRVYISEKGINLENNYQMGG